MAPKIVDKEQKRQEIALAAVEEFGDRGFERTRMEDVAKKAGVGKGTIYEYFANKEELMTGAFHALFTAQLAGIMPEPDSRRSTADTIRALLEKTVAAVAEFGFAYRFFLEYMLHASRSNEANDSLAEMLSMYRYGLAELIEEGIRSGEFREDVAPFETAATLAAWLDGAVFHWYTLPNTVSLERMGECFLDATLKGLLRKEEH